MRRLMSRLAYILSTVIFGLLAALFIPVFIMSLRLNLIKMCACGNGFSWEAAGSYMGLFAGFVAYAFFLLFLAFPRVRHNLNWFMNFTHELTHTLVAVIFLAKIREFVVKDRECYVSYQSGPVGYVPITLAPYCIPIYTLMIFPFRFVGDSHYMLVFDVLIAFTYAFHVHSFIKQTRYTQSDIEGCGLALSTTFITFIHACVLALICAIPRGGLMNALVRVFCEYPGNILAGFSKWLHAVL